MMVTIDDLIARGVNPIKVLGRAENLKLLADEAAAQGEKIIKILDEMEDKNEQ
jgi:hypothetical protein